MTYVTSVTATNSTTAQRSRRTRHLTDRGSPVAARRGDARRCLGRPGRTEVCGELTPVGSARDRSSLRHGDAADAEMRAAIAGAEVGDEQKREDPDRQRAAGARRATARPGLGALRADRDDGEPDRAAAPQRPGDVLVAEEHSHVLIYEFGGAAVHAGLVTLGVPGDAGRFTPEQIQELRSRGTQGGRPAPDAARRSRTRTTRRVAAAGRSMSWRPSRPRRTTHGLAVHLDGARLLNAVGRAGCAAVGDHAIRRHGHAVSLEGPRLPARRAPRRPRGAPGAGVARQAPLRRRDAPGGDRRRGRCLRARPPRRPARRRPRPRAAAGRRVARRRASRRPRAGRDELRAARPGAARVSGATRRSRGSARQASGCRRRSGRRCCAR